MDKEVHVQTMGNTTNKPKKNTMLSLIAVGVLLVVLAGGFVVVKSMNKKTTVAPPAEEEQVDLPPVDSSVEVQLTSKSDGKAVTLTVTKIPENTQSIEYELSYTTDKGLPKGALGKIDLTGKPEITREILLGTCSRNVCTYDTGVKSVNLVLRFNSASGATQFKKEYPL